MENSILVCQGELYEIKFDNVDLSLGFVGGKFTADIVMLIRFIYYANDKKSDCLSHNSPVNNFICVEFLFYHLFVW